MEFDFKGALEQMRKTDPAEPIRRILHSPESTEEEKQIARERLLQMRKADVEWGVMASLEDYSDEESQVLFEDRWRQTDRAKLIREAHRWWGKKPKAPEPQAASTAQDQPEQLGEPSLTTPAPEETLTEAEQAAALAFRECNEALDSYFSVPEIVSVKEQQMHDRTEHDVEKGFTDPGISDEQHLETLRELNDALDNLDTESDPRLAQFQCEQQQPKTGESKPLNHVDPQQALVDLQGQDFERMERQIAEEERKRREREELGLR